ncbi:MAG: hypothetical protein QOE31_3195, partial [Solirubrobacteraceae bacterium]|nr:hypothetical protein [Solirubrobacteraceae bacterium]
MRLRGAMLTGVVYTLDSSSFLDAFHAR